MTNKDLLFYKLPVEIAASKKLTQAEKLVAAYLFTLLNKGRVFYGSNAFLKNKIDVSMDEISLCLSKFESIGLISINTDIKGKRQVNLLKNDCFSGKFYRLYFVIANNKELTSLEKVLLSYILSFIDNNQRFYATNGVVKDILNISKDEFNAARKTFEENNWVKIIFPQTPMRELVIVNHPVL